MQSLHASIARLAVHSFDPRARARTKGGSSHQSKSAPSSAAAVAEEEEAAAAAQAACCVAILMQHPTNAHAMKRTGGLRQLAELIFESEDSEVSWARVVSWRLFRLLRVSVLR